MSVNSSAAPGLERRTRSVSARGADLLVAEEGDPSAPTILLVHGFPDTHRVWDELTERLRERFHVAAYDTRGTARSSGRGDAAGMLLEGLSEDLAEVIDAVSPDRPVHLVGHDWGAFQIWDALTRERLAGRIASFTPVCGPRLDQVPGWGLRRLARPTPSGIGQIGEQLRRSWYILAAQAPALPELALGAGIERGFGAMLRRVEGVAPREGHPAETLPDDAKHGLALYRRNMLRTARPRPPAADVPVQVILATGDPYISTGLYADCERWAPRIWRREIHAGHWVQRSRPDALARAIAEFAEHVEGVEPPPSLRRAWLGEERGTLAGRLAVVTGAAAGIGRATALALAREGAEVIAADVNLEGAARTAADSGELTHAVRLDVADLEAIEEFAARVEDEFGVPGIVVNNAGIGMGGAFVDTSAADWERIIDINLMGVVHGSRLFARQMVAAGVEGQIVNVASAAAYTPSRAMSAYATTKAAVLMLSECMRAELASSGIGVTAICPGVVATEITRNLEVTGVGEEEQQALRDAATAAYRMRGYGPEGVARAIVATVHENPAIRPVTPEAHALRAVSRFAPGLLRLGARFAPPIGR